MAQDCGIREGRTREGIVCRGIVDDQNPIHRTGLSHHGLDGPIDDIGIVEGVDVCEDTHRC
jgi:hypothetical protein